MASLHFASLNLPQLKTWKIVMDLGKENWINNIVALSCVAVNIIEISQSRVGTVQLHVSEHLTKF